MQQHVLSCMYCLKSISDTPKEHNCIVFPLYVVGAYACTPEFQRDILDQLDSIFRNLRFNCLLSVRATLEEIWSSNRPGGGWKDMFRVMPGGISWSYDINCNSSGWVMDYLQIIRLQQEIDPHSLPLALVL